MDNSTNIVTVRQFGSEKVYEINGRELPYVIQFESAVVNPDNHFVNVQFHANQVNYVTHGEDMPMNTCNPRADKYYKCIAEAVTVLRAARWWQLPKAVRRAQVILLGVLQ